ncbi:hypothetical protein [Actinomycetospora aeridis]|uniref:Antibiotic biosynthesis monooxygenase n=1 Tax=Actinomycetospora aeridis TaxID=3129231 RepID=A0ABU8N0V2_9PSEU
MTVHALADFPVDGYDYFRQAFADAQESGPARECRGARVFRSDDDRVLVLLEFDDTDALARFRAEMEKDTASGGDMAPPVFTTLHEEDDLVTRTRV